MMNTPTISDFVKGVVDVTRMTSRATSLDLASLAILILSVLSNNTVQMLAAPDPAVFAPDGSYTLPEPCPDLRLSYILSTLSTAVYGDDVIKIQEFPDSPDVRNALKVGTRIARETSRSIAQLAQKISTNLMKWTVKDHWRTERGEPFVTEQIAEEMKRNVLDSLTTMGKLEPSNIIHINIPKELVEPLWAVVEFEDYVALVIRGTWSFGDVITDAIATVQQVYNPPIPPTRLLLSERSSIRRGLPERFRGITLEDFDEIKRRMRESADDTPEAFMAASRAVLGGRGGLLEDDPQKVEGYYAHEGFILASSLVYYSALPVIQRLMDGGKRLVVTGHSLGAGVASLVGLHLRRLYPSVQVFAFAPPASVSLRMSMDMRDYVTSFILMNDIVPRLSVYSASRMLQTIEGRRGGAGREQLTLESRETLLPPGNLYHITYRDAPQILTRSKLTRERILRGHRPLTPSTTDVVLKYEDGFDRVSELPLILTSVLNHKPLDYSLALLEVCLAFDILPQTYEGLTGIIWL